MILYIIKLIRASLVLITLNTEVALAVSAEIGCHWLEAPLNKAMCEVPVGVDMLNIKYN